MQSWNFYLTTQIPFEIGKNTEPCSCRTPVSTLSKQPIKTLLVQFLITVVSSRSSFSGLFIRLSHIEISNSLLKSVYKTSTSSLSVKPINLTQNTIELACYDLFYASYNFCFSDSYKSFVPAFYRKRLIGLSFHDLPFPI